MRTCNLIVFTCAVRILRGVYVPRPLIFVGLSLARRWLAFLRNLTRSLASTGLACGVASQASMAFGALACALLILHGSFA